jgi:hypothetical protein
MGDIPAKHWFFRVTDPSGGANHRSRGPGDAPLQ